MMMEIKRADFPNKIHSLPMKAALITWFLALLFLPASAQPEHHYSVGLGKSEIEAWHLLARYQRYPSGRIGLNFGYIRPFNGFLMRPWYGTVPPATPACR